MYVYIYLDEKEMAKKHGRFLGFMSTKPALAHASEAGLAYINGLRKDGINATLWAKGRLAVVCPLSNRRYWEY